MAKGITSGVTAATLTALMLGSTLVGSPAQANLRDVSTPQLVAAIDTVEPVSAFEDKIDDAGFVAQTDVGTVQVDTVGTQGSISEFSATRSAGNRTDSVAVPLSRNDGFKAQRDESGALILNSDEAPNNYAIQGFEDGSFRMIVQIKDLTAPKEYRFKVALRTGQTMKVLDDGSVWTEEDGWLSQMFDAPWAKDASGKVIATHYRVEGADLVQVVNFSSGDQFPIAADPWTRHCGLASCTAYASKQMTKNFKDTLSSGGTAVSVLTGAAGCLRIPQPVVAGVCAAAVLIEGLQAAYNINAAANRGGCLAVNVNLAIIVTFPTSAPLAAQATTWYNVGPTHQYCKP